MMLTYNCNVKRITAQWKLKGSISRFTPVRNASKKQRGGGGYLPRKYLYYSYLKLRKYFKEIIKDQILEA